MWRLMLAGGMCALMSSTVGCGGITPAHVGHSEQHGSELNGSELNGSELNGSELNGSELNGSELNGSELNGSELNGSELNGSELNGTQFSAVTAEGVPLSGTDFVGVSFRGNVAPLHIDKIRRGAGDNADLFFYTVSVATPNGRRSLCGYDDSGAPREAIPLRGWWDQSGSKVVSPGRFTFACRRKALAKCVELGYKPWKSVGGTSLAAYHQACTRMIRADYCGDGRSWTVDGRLVNLYDNLGVQSDEERWVFEAEWTAEGARCVNKTRVLTLEAKGISVPSCIRERALRSPACGRPSHFEEGALLMSEYQSRYINQTD